MALWAHKNYYTVTGTIVQITCSSTDNTLYCSVVYCTEDLLLCAFCYIRGRDGMFKVSYSSFQHNYVHELVLIIANNIRCTDI